MNTQSKINPKTNKTTKCNLQSGKEINQEVDYFIAGPDKEADMIASVKNTGIVQ